MSQQIECPNNCGQQVYKFRSKRKNKDYYCESDKYNDFHNCENFSSKKVSHSRRTPAGDTCNSCGEWVGAKNKTGGECRMCRMSKSDPDQYAEQVHMGYRPESSSDLDFEDYYD